MPSITVTDHHVVFENPAPHIRARHAYFPGVVKLPSGDLLALFVLGEAMDATNVTTMVSRSSDQGQTWDLQGPLFERSANQHYYSNYLKPIVLSDGSLLATGYCFHRDGPDEWIANTQTDGMRGGDNLVALSTDEGLTWTGPNVIATTRPELVEASGPAIEMSNGTVLVAGSLFPTWEGTHPSGNGGVLLRSKDKGKTWDDQTIFFQDPADRYAPSEPRICEMQPGRIIALVWTTDHKAGKNLSNHFTVSHDGAETWSDPIDTGIGAQASNLMYLGGDKLLSIHAHREGETGLVVRIVDFTNDNWKVILEETIWGNAPSSQIARYADMAINLKFGQPSLLRLGNDDILATHWAVENGQGRILTHRIVVDS